MRVTVYGHTGVMGSPLYEWLKQAGEQVAGISLDRRDGRNDNPEWVFVCVPTPTDEDYCQDLSAVWDVLAGLPGGELNLVIRSTVLPGTCRRIRQAHPEWNVYHNPEFLCARTAFEDFAHPKRIIVGADNEGLFQLWREEMTSRLPGGEAITYYTDLATAEAIKYTHNVHGAMQVIYANLVKDMCDEGGADYEAVKRGITGLGYISEEIVKGYWNIEQDGYRGYGGACFPKDVMALRGYLGDKAELLWGMMSANSRLRAENCKKEKEDE